MKNCGLGFPKLDTMGNMTRINVASETSVAYRICTDIEKVSGLKKHKTKLPLHFQYRKPLQNSNLGEVDAIRCSWTHWDFKDHYRFFVHVHVLDQSAMQCFHQSIIWCEKHPNWTPNYRELLCFWCAGCGPHDSGFKFVPLDLEAAGRSFWQGTGENTQNYATKTIVLKCVCIRNKGHVVA